MTVEKRKLRDVSFQGYIVRFIQTITALGSFLVAAVLIGIDASNYAYALTLFSGLWTLLVLFYMTVAVHHWQKIYSFVAIVVLECLNIIFWAASLGTLASQFPVKYAIDGSHGNYSVVTVLVIVMIILAIIMFLAHVTTLVMLLIRARRFGPPEELKHHHHEHDKESADVENA